VADRFRECVELDFARAVFGFQQKDAGGIAKLVEQFNRPAGLHVVSGLPLLEFRL